MNFNTQHAPWSADLSAADQAAESFRARVGARQRLDSVPAEWADRFTPETWALYQRERFWCYHSSAGMLSPEGYLAGIRERDML
jgi:hypothetical protein